MINYSIVTILGNILYFYTSDFDLTEHRTRHIIIYAEYKNYLIVNIQERY